MDSTRRCLHALVGPLSWLLLVLGLSAIPIAKAADDNLLAHKLYQQGQYTQAAEIFTDPAWKGLALYRSDQWWRAAEAFIRADDPVSAYNLGNCYVKLGYFALALDAYQRALAGQPDMEDARVNADLMRELLAQDESEQEQAGRQPSEDDIAQLDSDDHADDSGTGKGGSEDTPGGEPTDGESNAGQDSLDASDNGTPGDGGRSDDEIEQTRSNAGGGASEGRSGEADPGSRSSGEAEGGRASEDSQAAGLRSALEDEQATEQWLNQIQHDPQRFLEKRIALELRRREAAGQRAPEGGSVW